MPDVEAIGDAFVDIVEAFGIHGHGHDKPSSSLTPGANMSEREAKGPVEFRRSVRDLVGGGGYYIDSVPGVDVVGWHGVLIVTNA